MKETVFALFLVTLPGISPAAADPFDIYHGGGNEIPLYVDSQLVTLRFSEEINLAAQQSILSAIDRIVDLVPDSHSIDNFVVRSLETGSGYSTFLDSLSAVSGIDYAELYYVNAYDSAMLVGREFCVRFDDQLSRSEIDSINAAMGVLFVREVEGMDNTFNRSRRLFGARNTPAVLVTRPADI